MTAIHWKSGVSGLFTTVADWNLDRVPAASDDVYIVASGAYTVIVSAKITIKSLSTVKTATLAIKSGDGLAISQGTGAGASAGTISVADGGGLGIDGTFQNAGEILLNSAGHATNLAIDGNTALTGNGFVELSDNSHNAIVGVKSGSPLQPEYPRLAVANTIEGAGAIGSNLTLSNEGRIIGDGTAAALIINTAGRTVGNSEIIDGSTPEGVTLVSNVLNGGVLEASGTNANLTIDGVVTNAAATLHSRAGFAETAGVGAHIGLSSAAIIGGTLAIGAGGAVEALANTGSSSLSNLAITGSGALKANQGAALDIANSTIATTDSLVTNGVDSAIVVNGATGALAGAINGGTIEFNGASAANVTFAPGSVGTLRLIATFTGTVSGLSGAMPPSFSHLFAFGDSTVDGGALQYLSPAIGDEDLTARLQNALANGGTDTPVGVGAMNTQDLAALFGLSAKTAYTTGGVIGGGGTNYAISGALDAADPGSGGDPGNGGLTNTFQEGLPGPTSPAVLSAVGQIQTYLNSTGGVADPSALYYMSSGANDVSFAQNSSWSDDQVVAYLASQAQTLATKIEALYDAGARHIIVNDVMNNKTTSYQDYSSVLYSDLDRSGIQYNRIDGREMIQNVRDNPGQYGFSATGVNVNDPALIEPDPSVGTGYGIWGANTTTPESAPAPPVDQYSYLAPPDNPPLSAEETRFYSDTAGHLSDAGQRIQADFIYNQLTHDAIDLTDLAYDPAHTTVSYSGNTTGGTLKVTNSTESESIELLGNYVGATFTTVSDGVFSDPTTGVTGALVMEAANSPQAVLTVHH